MAEFSFHLHSLEVTYNNHLSIPHLDLCVNIVEMLITLETSYMFNIKTNYL